MANPHDLILASLEHVAAAHGDPAEAVYAALFAAHPDLEALFVMDTDGGVRGAMLETCLDCVLDYIGPQTVYRSVMMAARNDHEGYGVPDALFDVFFETVRDTFRSMTGAAWCTPTEKAWQVMLDDLAQA